MSNRVAAAKLGRLESSNYVLQRGSAHKVLLFESQIFALGDIVVRVQDARNVLGIVSIAHGLNVVTVVEELEVKVGGRLGRPQTHRVDRVVAVAGHRTVVRHGVDGVTVDPLGHVVLLDRAAKKVDRYHVLGSRLLPRIAVAEPIVGLLHLPALFDALREDAIVISKTVAVGGQAERGHRVHEAGG